MFHGGSSGRIGDRARAGVEVAMITGDYPATAFEIARRCRIDVDGGVLTGPEIASLEIPNCANG